MLSVLQLYNQIALNTLERKNLLLKVGSCPNNDNCVELFFGLFYVVFKLFYQFYSLNLFLPRKLQDFAENSSLFRLFVSFLLEFRF